jgi:hypothetical protein
MMGSGVLAVSLESTRDISYIASHLIQLWHSEFTVLNVRCLIRRALQLFQYDICTAPKHYVLALATRRLTLHAGSLQL